MICRIDVGDLGPERARNFRVGMKAESVHDHGEALRKETVSYHL
jgi:hypothetical protein